MPRKQDPDLTVRMTPEIRERMRGQRSRQEFSKTTTVTVSVYPGDLELITWLTEFLGGSRSDAIRTAIRTAAAHFQEIGKQIERR